LLVKKYVMDHPTDHHIGKAVFVGVPNTGAPNAIKTLLQGDSFGIPWLADTEMQKIAKNLPVVYDLAPSQTYFNNKGSYVKVITSGFLSPTVSQDLDFNQANAFLTNDHQLNSQAVTNSQNLHTAGFDNYDLRTAGVDLYSINGCKTGTLSKIIERRKKFLIGGTEITYDQPQESPGDGTVPLESATNLPIDPAHKFYGLKADHGKMPSQDGIRQEIVDLISGASLNIDSGLITQDISKCKLKGKAVSIYSPLDIDVTDQAGNHAGLNAGAIQNNIPNADLEIMGDHKFVYLPNDEGQTYTINLKGTGSGSFTIKDEDITDNQTTGTQVFSNFPVTTSLSGMLNLGNTDTLSLDTNSDGTVDQTVQPSASLNPDQSQDLIPPVSTSTITGLMGAPGFYHSNATVTLTALDPLIPGQESQTSGVLKTLYSLDNGATTTYTGALSMTAEGPHTITFFSTDNAGNNELPQTISLTIDKTGPELAIQFNPISKDFNFSATDNQATAPQLVCASTLCTATDLAGNTTLVKFDKTSLSSLNKNLVLKSINYNGQAANFDPNLLAVIFSLSGGNVVNLSQTELIKNQQIMNLTYAQKQNQSIITDLTKGSKPQISTVPGVKILQIQTSGGKLKVTVK